MPCYMVTRCCQAESTCIQQLAPGRTQKSQAPPCPRPCTHRGWGHVERKVCPAPPVLGPPVQDPGSCCPSASIPSGNSHPVERTDRETENDNVVWHVLREETFRGTTQTTGGPRWCARPARPGWSCRGSRRWTQRFPSTATGVGVTRKRPAGDAEELTRHQEETTAGPAQDNQPAPWVTQACSGLLFPQTQATETALGKTVSSPTSTQLPPHPPQVLLSPEHQGCPPSSQLKPTSQPFKSCQQLS